MSVVVSPDEIARAMVPTKPKTAPPARTEPTRPVHQTARANNPPPAPIGGSKPIRQSARAIAATQSNAETPALQTIRLLGRTLDDLEKLRVQNGLRIGAAHRDGIDTPWAEEIDGMLRSVEHQAELQLARAWRRFDHPAVAWAKAIPGAGEILMARLFAEIGDPADRPNPGKLLAYCGHGDPARAGQVPKGATQEELFKRGNPHAKKAVWKLAYQFMRTVGRATENTESRQGTPGLHVGAATSRTKPKGGAPRSPYRDVYEQRKAATEGKLHDKPCVRCGPSGHPAKPGTPWSDAHRHADALRVVGKRFLIDLWVASRPTIAAADHGMSGREAQ